MDMDLMELMLRRRSVRRYLDEPIPEDILKRVIGAGLAAPTSRNLKPCRLVVIRDRAILKSLSAAKQTGAGMLPGAAAAIAVFADAETADTWVEDASIALSYMNLMAVECGLGSCWVQYHFRKDSSGTDAEENVKRILDIEPKYRLVGMLALGLPAESPAPHSADELDYSTVKYL